MSNNGGINNFTISIVGTSIKFLTLIGDLVANETDMTYNISTYKGKTCDYHTLRWSCNRTNKLEKITKLRDYLYNNASIFYTEKKKKLKIILNTVLIH